MKNFKEQQAFCLQLLPIYEIFFTNASKKLTGKYFRQIKLQKTALYEENFFNESEKKSTGGLIVLCFSAILQETMNKDKKKEKKKDKITESMKNFCMFYVSGKTAQNLTKSYQRAYPEAKQKTAQTESHRLLKKPEIKEEIQRIQREIHSMEKRKHVLTQENVIENLSDIATADITEIISFQRDKVVLKDSQSIQKLGLGKIIQSVKQTRDGVQVTLPNRVKTYELIAKCYGMLTENRRIQFQDITDVPEGRLNDIEEKLRKEIEELKEIKRNYQNPGKTKNTPRDSEKNPPLTPSAPTPAHGICHLASPSAHSKNPGTAISNQSEKSKETSQAEESFEENEEDEFDELF